ncbi:MAG: FAD-binding domain-containing protein [Pseudomonadota bacterium]
MRQTTLDLEPGAPPFAWTATRSEALARLTRFESAAGSSYARQRNFDFGPGKHAQVSQLSPWIRHRLLLERDVLRAVLQRYDLNQAEKFIQEVFWRGYFKGWLEHRPDVWRNYKRDLVRQFDQLDRDADLARRYDEAIEGRTGLDCFDSWTRELIETGYLHNHARMWFASIWIYTLRLPWQLGADFFYRHLVDGDPASNTCSWRWVCGLHTMGKTYLARASNIEKFTAGRFNPVGELATTAPALDEPHSIQIITPDLATADFAGRRVGLILTEEDGCIESLGLQHPVSMLALTAPTQRSVRPLGTLAAAFGPKAVRDASARAEVHFQVPTTDYSGPDWAEAVRDWAGENGLEACITARLPQGPVRKRLTQACRSADIELLQITRPYDQAVWPHARRGFFGLKKKIPSILDRLDLS